MDYLFDTNHACKILEGKESLSLRINDFKNSGSRFGISVSVLLQTEMEFILLR